jgi:F0F1-type ATP synthase membrane subunit b/b'
VQRITTEARRKAQEIVQSMRRETAEQVDAIVRAAAEAARREKEAQLAQAAADMDAAVRFDESRVRVLIEAVVRHVSGVR